MPRALQMREPHHGNEIPHVQARCRGIEAAVAGNDARAQRCIQRLRVLIQQPAPRELGQQRIHVGHRTNIDDTRGCVTTPRCRTFCQRLTFLSDYGSQPVQPALLARATQAHARDADLRPLRTRVRHRNRLVLLEPGLPRRRVPRSHAARRLPAAADEQALRRRRPLHRRARARAPHAHQARRHPEAGAQAFIITEDKRFYDHAGIDWTRVFGALAADVVHRNFAQGFSTITMQLARNIFSEKISREKTMTRKLKEAKVARQIEARYPKDKILELYLNQIYLGNGAYGVETAAQHYFGKSVRDLNLAEAATLAALPKGPERYNPRKYPDRTIQRRNTIIGLMRKRGRHLRRRCAPRPGVSAPARAQGRVGRARAVLRRVRAPPARAAVRRQDLHRRAQDLHDARHRNAAGRRAESRAPDARRSRAGSTAPSSTRRWRNTSRATRTARTKRTRCPNSPYLQGAVISMDPRNGAIRALIGGRDYDDSKFDRATQALRQPGSTFKPIVYADAIHNGKSASYILNDSRAHGAADQRAASGRRRTTI